MLPTSILFVCLGNICRSPMAEGIFLRILSREGTTAQFLVDSAGLLDYHQGELADNRMRLHAKDRGYSLLHRSRPVVKSDFERFDWIICMDDQNIRGLKQLTSHPKYLSKIHLMTSFCVEQKASQVPDPYTGGEQGFEHVIDLLEDACEGLYVVMSEQPRIRIE